jgi:N,N-dimethylformamidase beta subunit-like protein
MKRQLTAGASALLALSLGLICGASHGEAAFGSRAALNPIQAENANRGTPVGTWLQPAVPPTNVEGYTSEVSVLPGETVHLHVSTEDREQYRIEVYRVGWYGGNGARLLACLPSCGGSEEGRRYPPPSFAGMSANWPVTDRLTIPADWVSGYYYALFRVTSGSAQDIDSRAWAVFIVRDPPTRQARILVQVPVNTWQAYNPWGGKSLYDFNSRHFARASHVSFDRPLGWTAQGPFDWEYNLVRFLEREGYDVSYQTDVDTDVAPDSLLQHRLVIVAGHSEYWTKRMRDAFDAARDAGTNLAFTGSNAAYWQSRYEDNHRTLVVYKSTSDPEPDPSLQTVEFQHLVPPRPECELMGVEHLRLRAHESGPVDYTVTGAANTDPWFAGTGFKRGDKVLDVVGNEWDSLPTPPPSECVKGLTVLFEYPGAPPDLPADAVRYTAPSGARVFAGGAQQLSYPLDTFNLGRFGRTLPADPRFQQFMRNVLDDLQRPAAPTTLVVRKRRHTVRITVGGVPDTRVLGYRVFRHAGSGPFRVEDAGVVEICDAAAGETCTERRLVPGAYRFAVVSVDRWGSSYPTLSEPVVVRARR